jgi:hypothetical protein
MKKIDDDHLGCANEHLHYKEYLSSCMQIKLCYSDCWILNGNCSFNALWTKVCSS